MDFTSPKEAHIERRRLHVLSRRDLKYAKRIVIKAGTSTILNPDGYPSMARIANVVEDIFELYSEGREILLVTSGSVALGKHVLRRWVKKDAKYEAVSPVSRFHENNEYPTVSEVEQRMLNSFPEAHDNTFSAAGHQQLMSMYQNLLSQYGMAAGELLLTYHDFLTDDRRHNIQEALEHLLASGMVPILNENDAVTYNSRDSSTTCSPFRDNDGLAALVATVVEADLLIMLTDVDGLCDLPPDDPDAKVISTYMQESVVFGCRSPASRCAGMQSKLTAAQLAIDKGVPAVCICSGHNPGTIKKFLEGEYVGTLFVQDPHELLRNEEMSLSSKTQLIRQAMAAREGSRQLNALTSEERSHILTSVSKALDARRHEIFAANHIDMMRAKMTKLPRFMAKRLELNDQKINTLITGIESLASNTDPLGETQQCRELDGNLILSQKTCSIGVMLIVFESRPDCLPQIAALALRTGNGLLLKGGHEAERSNEALHKIIVDTVAECTQNRINKGVIGLVTSRADVFELLKLDSYIDMVVPRGSDHMVRSIRESTIIPVLSHADGACHVYVHSDADLGVAIEIVADAKMNYPAACNAAETLLIHQDLVASGKAKEMVERLRGVGIKFRGGPRARVEHLAEQPMECFHHEYGDEHMTVEIVDDMESACAHINSNGSHHTDTIVTTSNEVAHCFKVRIDSACVFHNASTRFADGYRFGLGAEVGVSTGRIHARGPVGVEGLMTQKWILESKGPKGAIVADFDTGIRQYTHVNITPKS